MSIRLRVTGISILAFALAGCQSKEAATTDTAAMAATAESAAVTTLYDRLGGQAAITSVVDSFVAIVAKDARINKKFARSDVGRVKTMLVEQVCAQTG